ncbi:hypothetical protein B0A48_17289 [Cryoendolithus antarcticus]|uniref:Uncharacterized protein n=1 Tax=Cryoendolithus antarcticus TaxID=1507870 RepID=A0A1V8SC59_9PEZI|nr:hypothetical protein B0A48_17289 [Cryoendolithus antarcticus]
MTVAGVIGVAVVGGGDKAVSKVIYPMTPCGHSQGHDSVKEAVYGLAMLYDKPCDDPTRVECYGRRRGEAPVASQVAKSAIATKHRQGLCLRHAIRFHIASIACLLLPQAQPQRRIVFVSPYSKRSQAVSHTPPLTTTRLTGYQSGAHNNSSQPVKTPTKSHRSLGAVNKVSANTTSSEIVRTEPPRALNAIPAPTAEQKSSPAAANSSQPPSMAYFAAQFHHFDPIVARAATDKSIVTPELITEWQALMKAMDDAGVTKEMVGDYIGSHGLAYEGKMKAWEEKGRELRRVTVMKWWRGIGRQ